MTSSAALALAGPSAGTKLISASLIDLKSGKHVLDLNGENKEGLSSRYRVNLSVHHLPCDGRYRYVSFGEDVNNGASTSLDAELRLKRLSASARRGRCGRLLPSRGARARVSARLFNPEETPLSLWTRSRRADGTFRAVLDLGGTLACNQPYRFAAGFMTPRVRLLYRYRVEVLAASAGLDSETERIGNCKFTDKR
jgi:hypothetical protein